MSVKYTSFVPIRKAEVAGAIPVALRLMLEDIDKTAEPNTPMKFGPLRSNILKQVLGNRGTIQWRQLYAAYQERGMRFDGTRIVKQWTTGGTGSHFAANAVKKVIAEADTYFRSSGL